MANKYIAGKGTTIGVTIASAVTTLAQVQKITPPKMSREEIDTSHLGSLAKEKMAAIADGGDVEFTVEWWPEDTGHAYLWTSFQAGANETWTITLSDGTTIVFTGFLKEFPWDEVSLESAVTIKFTIAVTAPLPVITPSA